MAQPDLNPRVIHATNDDVIVTTNQTWLSRSPIKLLDSRLKMLNILRVSAQEESISDKRSY